MHGPTEQPWHVEVSAHTEKRLNRIVSSDRERILRALMALRGGPTAGDVKPLHGRSEWRPRVGRWRVILDVYPDASVIVAVEAGPRGDIYK